MLDDRYRLRLGSTKEQALLVKFITLTYAELFPEQPDFSHLAKTVQQYFSKETPLWWVEFAPTEHTIVTLVGCLWMGNAIDQVSGDRYSHIFLLYVFPDHRRCGVGSVLMQQAQQWAETRGDRQIGLQVFGHNRPALSFYQHLGFKTQSFLMFKQLKEK